MRIKALRGIGDPRPLVQSASVVIIERDDGTPIAAACDVANGAGTYAETAAHPEEFRRMLQVLGFDRLVIVERLDPQLKPPHQLPLLG